MGSEWRVLGVEDSDGDQCECCGTACPKRRVVLTNGHEDRRFGSLCAALAVKGRRDASAARSVENDARKAQERARQREQNRRNAAVDASPEVRDAKARGVMGRELMLAHRAAEQRLFGVA